MQKLYNTIYLNNVLALINDALAHILFFNILCTLLFLLLLKYYFHGCVCLVFHVSKDSFLKWSWWKLHSVLNQNQLTWKIDLNFNSDSTHLQESAISPVFSQSSNQHLILSITQTKDIISQAIGLLGLENTTLMCKQREGLFSSSHFNFAIILKALFNRYL